MPSEKRSTETTSYERRREELAKLIAEEVGYTWDSLYEHKSEWIDDRGLRHDVNTPYKTDFRCAADAVVQYFGDPTP